MSAATLTGALHRRVAEATEAIRVRPLVAAGRAVLWAAVAVIVVRGLVSFLPDDAGAVPAAPARPEANASYPQAAAMAFAARFATDYLTYDDADPEAWRRRLSQYVGEDVASGWQAAGKQQPAAVVPVTADVKEMGLAVVTVAAQVGGKWLHLGVPVAADAAGRLAVAGPPAFTAAPGKAAVPKGDAEPTDPEAAARVAPALDAFFRAYAAGDATGLAYYLSPGYHLDGLGGSVTFQSLDAVRVSPGPAPREATATVTWAVGGATFAQTYGIRLIQREGRFYVDNLGPALPDRIEKGEDQ